jgi:glycosyltransferase involved in cell wall biosynthesis
MRRELPPAGNILMVSNHASDIGYAWWLMENFWAEIAQHYAAKGRRSFLVYPKLAGLSERIEHAPIQVEELDWTDRSPAALRRLRDFVRANSIAIIYLTDAAYFDTLYTRLRAWGVRVIIDHDHSGAERPRASLLQRFVKGTAHRIGTASCDHYIAVSRFIHDRFLAHVCVPPSKCSLVINGIVPIAPATECRRFARILFGIPDDATIVVSTGRASRFKGVHFLIDCAHTLIHERGLSALWFLHCGDGPDLLEFRQMVVQRDLTDRFILAGRRDDVRCILQSCDIAIQASLCEAFSLSLLEYMSAGLATLAPAVCGNVEAIEDGITGHLYASRDGNSVVALIERLARDPSERSRLGEAARQVVARRFTLQRCNQELLATLDAILHEAPDLATEAGDTRLHAAPQIRPRV